MHGMSEFVPICQWRLATHTENAGVNVIRTTMNLAREMSKRLDQNMSLVFYYCKIGVCNHAARRSSLVFRYAIQEVLAYVY